MSDVKTITVADQVDTPEEDIINKPRHYNSLGAVCSHCGESIECIDIAKNFNFALGNVIKYCWRSGRKTISSIEDLEKSRWYLNYAIEDAIKNEGGKK